MDYKLELQKLLTYCIENRNYLKASESSADRTAADAYQDVRTKIHEIFEREGEFNNENSGLHKHFVMQSNSSSPDKYYPHLDIDVVSRIIK